MFNELKIPFKSLQKACCHCMTNRKYLIIEWIISAVQWLGTFFQLLYHISFLTQDSTFLWILLPLNCYSSYAQFVVSWDYVGGLFSCPPFGDCAGGVWGEEFHCSCSLPMELSHTQKEHAGKNFKAQGIFPYHISNSASPPCSILYTHFFCFRCRAKGTFSIRREIRKK